MIDPIRDRSLSPTRRAKHAVFLAARGVLLPIMRVVPGMKVYGLKNIPRRGGAIVICNHLDWWDPILLMAAVPRPIFWMAKKEFLGYPVASWLALQAGVFPVDRGKPDRAALRHAQALLENGMLLGMFPEGTRSSTGALKEPFTGASLVAVRSGAPIIPCAMIGTEYLPLSGLKEKPPGKRPRVTAIVGEPFRLEMVTPDGRKRRLDELTEAMMIEIARLLPERNRGLYAAKANAPHPAVRRDAIVFSGPKPD